MAPFIRLALSLLVGAFVGTVSAPSAGAADAVQSRPAIAGDYVKPAALKNEYEDTIQLSDVLRDKYTVLIYATAEDFTDAQSVNYFNILDKPLRRLDYQFVIIYPSRTVVVPKEILTAPGVTHLFDDAHRSFEDMGLADVARKQGATRSGIFLVGPTSQILFEFAASSREIPLSSEVLILAARVSRNLDDSEKEGARSRFRKPDRSIIDLLSYEDIAHPDAWWAQFSLGATIYDVDRDYWAPRWSPGVQIGKRFGRYGGFLNLELDQSFDLSQETKHIEVFHVGPGVEYLFFLGRMRSSLSAGLAFLESETEIDDRGSMGWYADFRPISVRWAAFDNKGAFELTPFSLDVSVPVTHGIPMVLFAYFTTVSFEWTWGP